ncbi:hypothetical protein PHYBOEH_011860 [Phytophthora boehmeriae]|uniref:Uncharacterized protein n=1 Tax=Phytophthora boehmeriae TaxID=109152 RepID=A0A8T1X0M2_9STRA|nr:hypothetical protein PHYBOEH_011860 [Phytophthora boehmeriae]
MGLWSFCFNTTGGRVPEFPLQQLQEAIETRDGSKALKVLRKRRIRSELAHSTTTHKVPSGPDQKKCNVFTCVETAVHYQMPHVVIAMYRFNPADVRLATWFALHRLSRPKAGQSSNPECLLDWDASSKYQILHWGDQDEDGKTALGLSCLHGHGRLASFILDQLQPQDEVGLNTPLQALFAALESRDERCVVDLLRNRKVRRAVEKNNRRVERLPVHGEWIQVQSQQQDTRSTDREVTVSSCVAMAVELEMVRVVQLMHRLNRQCVGHATWFAIYNALEPRSRRKMVSARRRPQVRVEFRDIADLYRRDCIWERMQLVFLIRYAPERSQKMTKNKGGLPLNIVAEIPDALFRIVVEFLKPEFDDAEEAQKERFKSVLDLSSW